MLSTKNAMNASASSMPSWTATSKKSSVPLASASSVTDARC
ncbi:MAG: hypothetical protein AAGH64_02750 [Planctomycetota bacterium]